MGGAIRDNLLGYPNKDFDLATGAPPDAIRKLFHRSIPVGVEHGTVAVLDSHGRPHEVTTFRRDVKTDGRHAQVEFGVSLDEDLARRDFTINAIAYHPLRHEWRDPFDGAGDLTRQLVRAVGDPTLRFREDYLRILRALRFAVRFGFAIAPETWTAAQTAVPGLQHLSAERVRDEWFKGLESARQPSALVTSWVEIGAAALWLPDIASSTQEIAAIDRFPEADPVLITSFLSQDPEASLRRLKCSNAEIERGRRIAHGRGAVPPAADEVAVRRWLAAVGPAADDLLAIATAERGNEDLANTVARVRASGAALAVGDLAVNGRDLIAAGVPEGPIVGQLLQDLLHVVLERPELNERSSLMERVRHQVPSTSERPARNATEQRE